MKRAAIDRKMLDYRRFRTFLKTRGEKIRKVVKNQLRFSNRDF